MSKHELYARFCIHFAEVLGCDYITSARIVDEIFSRIKSEVKTKRRKR
jgi:hypothetical protein